MISHSQCLVTFSPATYLRITQTETNIIISEALYGAIYKPSSGSVSEIVQMKNMQIYILLSIFRAKGRFYCQVLVKF